MSEPKDLIDSLVRSIAVAAFELAADRIHERRPKEPARALRYSRHQLAEEVLEAVRGAARDLPPTEYGAVLELLRAEVTE